MSGLTGIDDAPYRRLEPQWDGALIAASIGISFLGSFTSCALMCQARISVRFLGVLLWSLAASFVFGFCSIWALHEVAMLACKLDVPIGVNAPLTILSAVLAVFFTWVALAFDMLWLKFYKTERKRKHYSTRYIKPRGRISRYQNDTGSTPLLIPSADYSVHEDEVDQEGEEENGGDFHDVESSQTITEERRPAATSMDTEYPGAATVDSDTAMLKPPSHDLQSSTTSAERGFFANRNGLSSASKAWLASGFISHSENSRGHAAQPTEETGAAGPGARSSSDWSSSQRDSSAGGSSSGYLSAGLNSALGVVYRKGTTTSNAFIAVATALYAGCTATNILKGLFWSIAIDSMHYCGVHALKIPHGYYTLNPMLVLASASVCWLVCVVGVVLMSNMETRLGHQLLFSIVATAGVACMHFSSIVGVKFYSREEVSEVRGYPPALANAVIAIAGITCVIANLLLAHSATASRNKLAEIVWTRKELWKAIAQKENAEAASMARSEFIASASHEIRTPLHHLQGYSDLLSQQELTEEGRALLSSIQRATKTLSMITTNVLDWSKLERNAESAYQPTIIDIRNVCESIINLLPNLDDESSVELFMVVAPDVPPSLFMDETYIHRILMNLLSNALKFTRSGYVMLSIEINGDKLILKVEDTGCGLSPEFMPRMWDPFQQGEVRGKHRGTGLGLSIIKQLLQRMQGTIDVESRYRTEDCDPSFRSGSVFTISLPLQTTTFGPEVDVSTNQEETALLVEDLDSLYAAGVQASWLKAGYDVTICSKVEDLPQANFKYIWADASYLKRNLAQFEELMQHNEWIVLVPGNSQDSLNELAGIQTAKHFVVLQKPLIWHLFEKRVQQQQQRPADAAPSKTLRFAPAVEVMPDIAARKNRPRLTRKLSRKAVVLLVEDNPINQKLGKKMLTSLGYEVVTADDGQAGIDELVKNDLTIDVVLMDESMPRKCGTQATKEIRDMEATGKLSKRHPIIAVTAVVNPKAQQAFKDAGADDFLAKPLALVKLRDTLADYILQA